MKQLCEILFYSFAVVPLYFETRRVLRTTSEEKHLTNVEREINDASNRGTDAKVALLHKHWSEVVFECLYVLWAWLGLITFLWPVFALFIVMGRVHQKLRDRWNNDSTKHDARRYLMLLTDAMISVVLITAIILLKVRQVIN